VPHQTKTFQLLLHLPSVVCGNSKHVCNILAVQVLDMCAAPGSKTFQLLEMLHNMEGAADGSTTPSGFVVANDADAQRCNLLTHQTKRMCSPCLMVTNHNGEQFPRITGLQPAPGSAAAAAAAVEAAAAGLAGQQQQQAGGEVMLFDRILCDVPCSGDGTMRKAPDIWRRWSVNNGNGLHNMQLRIALHAVRLLKVCGLVCLCSVGSLMHPFAVCLLVLGSRMTLNSRILF
jgi:16S rRNA C967 or C1407 C5-methylase (RsmB/RsmF family)